MSFHHQRCQCAACQRDRGRDEDGKRITTPTWLDPRYQSYPLVLVIHDHEILKVDRHGNFTVSGQPTGDPQRIVSALREWAIAMARDMAVPQ
jgi:hypothetical protein